MKIIKISVWAKNRREAIQKMQSALGEVIIEGVDTNVNYQYALLNHPDFLAGNIKRAPRWISQCGLEWFYRFLKEPRRLFKRYFIDDMGIVKLVWKYRSL